MARRQLNAAYLNQREAKGRCGDITALQSKGESR
jgi:hypothetical protein